MTVAELIDELKKYDPETAVATMRGAGYAPIEVERVGERDYPRFGGRKEYVVIE